MAILQVKRCPLHPNEYLKRVYIKIKTPDIPKGIDYYLENYCPIEKKFFDEDKMVSPEEYALKEINYSQNKNYQLKDIVVSKIKIK